MPQMKPVDDGTLSCETSRKPQDVTGVVTECDLWLSKASRGEKVGSCGPGKAQSRLIFPRSSGH
jgi:hypothetical protein